MLRTKKTKFLIVLALVFTMLLPYATPVMAETIKVSQDAILKQSDLDGQSLKISGSEVFKSSTASTTSKCYAYTSPTLSSAKFFQVVVVTDAGTPNFDNVLYCIDSSKKLLQADYTNQGNVFTDLNATKLHNDYQVSGMNEDVYKSLSWILQNMYVESEADSLDAYLNKVFGAQIAAMPATIYDDDNNTQYTPLELIKKYVKAEDIHMLQQAAIWYFTNPTEVEGITLNSTVETQNPNTGYAPASTLTSANVQTAYTIPTSFKTTNGTTITTENPGRSFDSNESLVLSMLFSYLITNAKKAQTSATAPVTATNPKFVETNVTYTIETSVDNESYYKFGPFKIENIANADVDLEIQDYSDSSKKIQNYEVLESTAANQYNVISENAITYSAVAGKDFYVYVPTTEDITGINIKMNYKTVKTDATFWYKEGNQPVVLVTRTPEEGPKRGLPIKKYDLALRKYIVAIDGTELQDSRKPVVDATGLINNVESTAIYKHAKTPVEISVDSKITYELRVYNEGDVSAVVTQIKDYVPDGMELAPESIAAGWTLENGVATLNIQNGTLAAKNNAELENAKDSLTGGLSTVAAQITLQIKEDAKASISNETILTNIAEISNTSANTLDSDSTPNNFRITEITDRGSYNGSGEVKPNYIAGIEDDDDFDKVKVIVKEKPVIDLALQKFITSVNGTKLTGDNNREPKVNTQRLKDFLDGKTRISDATYTTKKTPVKVEKGDIVTYTIRVYNEGSTDAYAQEITDYIPEGLGYLVNYDPNTIWKVKDLSEGSTIPLSKVDNAVANAKKVDGITNPENITVVKGKLTLTTDELSYENEKANSKNVLTAFDGSDKLSYKDVEVTCVVLADELKDDNLKNIAEISKHAIVNEDRTVITSDDEDSIKDRDSTPNNVKTKSDEDDDDTENLTMENKIYDLALQKFITAVDGKAVTDREPVVTVKDGNVQYNHSTKALEVANGQLVEYTIRVYNEGNVETVAAEVADDLPKGLEFVADNEVNKAYGWELYDKDGKVTKNASLAETVRTTKLAGAANAIEGFDPSKDKQPKYKDLKIVFKVNDSFVNKTKDTDARTIINTAEITKETDKENRDVTDKDSTPNNWKENEDDIDKERIYIKYFDLALEKKLVKVIVTESGRTTEYELNDDTLFKVELNKKKLNSTVVKFVYEITVTNEGEIDGYATEIKDYIPQGLEFVEDDNTGWYSVGSDVVATEALAQTLLTARGGSASTQITLKWINSPDNMGKKINVAEISKDKNPHDSPDVDSTPDNRIPEEDDIDDAPVLLSISTGASKSYTGLIVAVAIIMTTGVVLIKKYVL